MRNFRFGYIVHLLINCGIIVMANQAAESKFNEQKNSGNELHHQQHHHQHHQHDDIQLLIRGGDGGGGSGDGGDGYEVSVTDEKMHREYELKHQQQHEHHQHGGGGGHEHHSSGKRTIFIYLIQNYLIFKFILLNQNITYLSLFEKKTYQFTQLKIKIN